MCVDRNDVACGRSNGIYSRLDTCLHDLFHSNSNLYTVKMLSLTIAALFGSLAQAAQQQGWQSGQQAPAWQTKNSQRMRLVGTSFGVTGQNATFDYVVSQHRSPAAEQRLTCSRLSVEVPRDWQSRVDWPNSTRSP